MRSHHDEIGGGRLGDRKNLGVNARAKGYKYLGMGCKSSVSTWRIRLASSCSSYVMIGS